MRETKKIAVMGSAPSSVLLAPFDDPSWQIWGCSPGLYPVARRVSRWFEVHRWEPGKPWFTPEYIGWMAKLQCPVLMVNPVPELPNSQAYPIGVVLDYVYAKHLVPVFDGMEFAGDQSKYVYVGDQPYVWVDKRFDRTDFSSTIAWMLALAIIEGATEIGLWGVDMSATEEWMWQRSGCQSIIDVAKSLGIKITVPPESDLLRPPPLYGFCEIDPAHGKYVARRDELVRRRNDAMTRGQLAQREVDHLNGAIEDMEYHRFTWIGNPFHLSQNFHSVAEPIVFSPAPAAVTPAAPVAPVVSDPGVADGNGKGVGGVPAAASPETDDWRTLEGKLGSEASATLSSTLAELSAALGIEAPVVNGDARA